MTGLLVVYFGLHLARIGTFVAVLPRWGGQSLPKLVKLGLTLALTVLWFGTGAEKTQAGDWVRQGDQVSWLVLGIALAREAVLGAILGYAFGLFLVPVQIAGDYLTQELGLSFAGLVTGSDTSASALTTMFEALAVLVFLSLDGHHVFFGVLHGTFLHYPAGGSMPGLPIQNLVSAAAITEEWGLMLAAPVALCVFLTTVVLALMARAVPQLNLYTVGFALRLVVGLSAILILLPNMLAAVVSIFGNFGELIARLI